MGQQLTIFEMNDRAPVVKVRRGARSRIRRNMGVSYSTIGTALRFETFTPLARMIRAYALQDGGVLGVREVLT